MKKEFNELKEDVSEEVAAIEKTLIRLYTVKDKFDKETKRDYLVEPAIGTYLMNFYNGIENILKRICKVYYLSTPMGGSWHKELLSLSMNPPEGKTAVFKQSIVEKLHSYRSFRHRFVSGYGFQLRGEKMLELIENIGPLWKDIKNEISIFFNKI